MSIWANDIGKRGERIAVRYLKKNRYKILETNRHQSHNEIDIIATNRDYLVFVEVKTRSVVSDTSISDCSAAAAVNKGKQWRTIRAAEAYMARMEPITKQPRMDVIEVYLERNSKKLLKLNHIPNAYGKT